jgi:uncharacterized protein
MGVLYWKKEPRMMVGIISGNHGPLRPEAVQALRGCRHIIHDGDIGALEIILTSKKLG